MICNSVIPAAHTGGGGKGGHHAHNTNGIVTAREETVHGVLHPAQLSDHTLAQSITYILCSWRSNHH